MSGKLELNGPALQTGDIIDAPNGLKFKVVRVICDAGKQQRGKQNQRREYKTRWNAGHVAQERERKRDCAEHARAVKRRASDVERKRLDALNAQACGNTPIPPDTGQNGVGPISESAPLTVSLSPSKQIDFAKPGDFIEMVPREIQLRQVRAREREAKARERERVREWKKAHPSKVRDHERRRNDNAYHRPFVGIDSEGMDYPGNDILLPHGVTDELGNPLKEVSGVPVGKDIIYPEHHTFLWGAKGWQRRYSATELADNPALPRTEGNATPEYWLGDESKRPLSTLEILEWLTSLPEKLARKTAFRTMLISCHSVSVMTWHKSLTVFLKLCHLKRLMKRYGKSRVKRNSARTREFAALRSLAITLSII